MNQKCGIEAIWNEWGNHGELTTLLHTACMKRKEFNYQIHTHGYSTYRTVFSHLESLTISTAWCNYSSRKPLIYQMRTQQLSVEHRHSRLLFTSHAIHTIHDNPAHPKETPIHSPHLQLWKVYSSWEQQCSTFHHEFIVSICLVQIILEDVTERFSITSKQSKYQWS